MEPPTVQEILDKIDASSFKLTLNFLINHDTCDNPNENSIKSALNRVQGKVASLRKKAVNPNSKGNAELDIFLKGPFPFPANDRLSTGVKP